MSLPPSSPSPLQAPPGRSRRPLPGVVGAEERVVLELGSAIWKAGFSSEPRPRVVASVDSLCGPSTAGAPPRTSSALAGGLRRIFYALLLVDPRLRAVVLVEGPLVGAPERAAVAQVLFEGLGVPALALCPGPPLVVLSQGVLSGLVVDVGEAEVVVVPVFHARPLFALLCSSPRAGRRLGTRLAALLAVHARFLPLARFVTSSASAAGLRLPRPSAPPCHLLSPAVLQDIRSRLLLVSPSRLHLPPCPPSPPPAPPLQPPYDEAADHVLLAALKAAYAPATDPRTRDVLYRVPASPRSPADPPGACAGILSIPAWIRERAPEILFHPSLPDTLPPSAVVPEEEEESRSVTETVLDCLLRLPIDLRKTMASNIVVCGGTAMLPGFTKRFRAELLSTLESSHLPSPARPGRPNDSAYPRIRNRKRFSPISSLSSVLNILNDPQPLLHSDHTPSLGSPPAPQSRPASFQMNLLSWIGASLAGALKISGQEIIKERWDSIIESSLVSQEILQHNRYQGLGTDESGGVSLDDEKGEEQVEWEKKMVGVHLACSVLPDWTKLSL